MQPEFRQHALSSLSQLGALELDEFWAVVAKIRWEDPAAPHEEPLVALGLRDCVRADARFWSLRFALESRLEAWEGGRQKIPCGDDSFGDLVSHVIGLGEETYVALIAKPQLAVLRAETHEYPESFAYVFQMALEKFPDELVHSELVAAKRPRPWIDGKAWPRASVVEHEQFGLGIVVENAEGGVSIAFESAMRVLPGSIEVPPDPRWLEATRNREPASAIPYAASAKLASGDLVSHATFGLGVVTTVADGKATVLFSTGEKKLRAPGSTR